MAYYLQMNGTTDGIIVPSFSWDTVELDVVANPLSNFTKIISLQNGGFVQFQSGVNYSFDNNFSAVAVNGSPVTTLTPFLTANVRATLRAVRSVPTASLTYLFRTMGAGGVMRGILYSAKYYLGGVLQCHYDFKLGHAQDQSGNSRDATVTGTFVNDGPSSTPVSYLFDTKQQIVVNRSSLIDTKQQIVVNRSQLLDTKQSIVKNTSVLFDTFQEIYIDEPNVAPPDPPVRVSYLFDTKQEIFKKVSILFPTRVVIEPYREVKDTIRDYTGMDWENRDR